MSEARRPLVERVIVASARHPVPVVLGGALLAAVSYAAMRAVPVDAIPDLTDRQIILYTEWEGQSPSLVEDQITQPLSSAMLGLAEVRSVRGISVFGASFVWLVLHEEADVGRARARVIERLAQVQSELPEGVQPRLGPEASGVGWVFQYALVDRGGRHTLGELRALHDRFVATSLRSVQDVAEVAAVGGFEQEIHVTVLPERLEALGLSVADVAGALASANLDAGAGAFEMGGREVLVRGRGRLRGVEDVRAVALDVHGPSGAALTVGDVAEVTIGAAPRRGVAELDGRGEVVGGIVVARDGADASTVIAAVRERLAELQRALPEGVEIVTVYDRSKLIDRVIATLRGALIEELIVVAIVVVLFLRHVRSALLPVGLLPLGVAAAFVPMAALGISSNAMSLGGLAIAIGSMVDAAIVLVDNAHKRLETAPPGADRRAVLVEAATEVGPAIFFALMMVAVSFLPVFGLVGEAGRLFRPLAATKTFAMLAAALLAITIGPALLGWLVRGRIRPEREHPLSRWLLRLYEPFVLVALRRPRTTVLIGVLAVLSAVPLWPRLGEEFMPTLEEGDLLYMPTTVPGVSIEEAARALARQDRALRAFPEVQTVFGKVGRAETATDPAPLDMVETVVQLHPRERWRTVHEPRWWSRWPWAAPLLRPLWRDERPLSYAELVAQMSRAAALPGWVPALTMPIRTRIDMLSTGIRTPLGVKVLGDDASQLEHVARAVERALARVPGARGVLAERVGRGLTLDVLPDRAALREHGLRVQDVLQTVQAAVGGIRATTVVDGRRRVAVRVVLPRAMREGPEALAAVRLPVGVPDESGHRRHRIPLGEVARIERVEGPVAIRSDDGRLAVYVYADFDERRVALGSFIARARDEVRRSVEVPSGVEIRWTGRYEQLVKSRERLAWLVPLAVLIALGLLYAHLRNVVEVLLVASTVPVALVGSIWALYLLDYRLSVAVWVGIIALVGLATQTGLVMVMYLDRAYEARWRAGRIRSLEDIVEAHREGTVQRLRPKLMTVLTTAVGLLPLMWATGTGAEVMKRIAAPMLGGLVTSTFLTLEILPVIYTYWRWAQVRRALRRGRGPTPEASAVPQVVS
ncbi:MAG: efflux RND transporter permease subunit [Myxococcota bacterium]|nr:efflux RND transporter permease subunit [Myxococcota bacterium]